MVWKLSSKNLTLLLGPKELRVIGAGALKKKRYMKWFPFTAAKQENGMRPQMMSCSSSSCWDLTERLTMEIKITFVRASSDTRNVWESFVVVGVQKRWMRGRVEIWKSDVIWLLSQTWALARGLWSQVSPYLHVWGWLHHWSHPAKPLRALLKVQRKSYRTYSPWCII